MDNPRAEKVAVVNEVRDRLDASDAAVLTEYRGLTVAELAQLRRELVAAGGDYKIYKNTLVRLAVAEGPRAPLHDMLTGPIAITFVQGDVSAVAKALRDFARSNPEPDREGWHGRRRAAVGLGLQRPRRPPLEGGAAVPVGRGACGTARAAGRADPGATPQPGLRPVGPDRSTPGSRRRRRPSPLRTPGPSPRPPTAGTQAGAAESGDADESRPAESRATAETEDVTAEADEGGASAE